MDSHNREPVEVEIFDPSHYELPPIKSYPSRAAALHGVNDWARSKGYALSNAPSKSKKPGGRVKAIFGCDRRESKPEAAPMKEREKGGTKLVKAKGADTLLSAQSNRTVLGS
jgi:hypothetical protein